MITYLRPEFDNAQEERNQPKKKRKFRAMTIGEHCNVEKPVCKKCEYRHNWFFCDYSDFNQVYRAHDKNKPYKTKDGKYILVEVKE